jgi:hypothetical protein
MLAFHWQCPKVQLLLAKWTAALERKLTLCVICTHHLDLDLKFQPHRVIILRLSLNPHDWQFSCGTGNFRFLFSPSDICLRRCWILVPLHSSQFSMFNHHSTNNKCSIWRFLTHYSFSHQYFSWYDLPFLCWVALMLALNVTILKIGELLQLIHKCDGTSGNLAVCDFQTYFCLFHFLLSQYHRGNWWSMVWPVQLTP